MFWFERTDIDLTAPMACDLDGDVCRCAEAIEPKALAWLDAAETQRPIADNTGTQ
jgi:hypothetical protein